MNKKIIIIGLVFILIVLGFAYKYSNITPEATSAIVKSAIGQKSTGLKISITPEKIISDSRCPLNVQCIWAGTVEVQTLVDGTMPKGEFVFELNKPKTFGNFIITLIEVAPTKTAGVAINDSSYNFTFEIKNK